MAKTHKKEDILKSFLNDLNFIYDKQDLKLSIMTLSLYSEYIINRLIKKNFGQKLDDDKDVTHSIKLKFLRGSGIIAQSEYYVLDRLRKFRNELVHKLSIEIKEETLNKILSNVEPNYMDESIKQEFKRKSKIARFIWASISKIYWLIIKFYNEENLILVIRNQKFVLEKRASN